MAGSYPDVPGYRFAYDVDGTIFVARNLSNGEDVSFSSGAVRGLNSESMGIKWSASGASTYLYRFLFPEARDISGVLFNSSSNMLLRDLEWSNDTTNGLDGSWNLISTTPGITITQPEELRHNITTVSVAGVTALRLRSIGNTGNRHLMNIHLYGSISPVESPNRLRVVDLTDASTTGDESTITGNDISALLDFGNIKQRATATKQFKIVNNSASLSAHNITVGLDAPSDSSPSLIGQFQVSTDNIAFANAINLGTLSPGQRSGTMYLRNNVASNATLGVWSVRVIAHAVSWS